MKILRILFFLMLLTFPVEMYSQAEDSGKIKKSDKNLISVPIVVSDREGHYIPNLKKENFTVYQDGVKQNIAFFSTFDEPVNVALLLDTSGSTEDVLKEIKDAAKDFVELLNRNDKCLVATFDSEVKILNPLTSDHKTIKKSLDQIQNARIGGTLMYRTVEQVTKNSFANVQGRKVIILLTDGKDFGSAVTKDELLGQLEESDVLIYTIFYKTGADVVKTSDNSDATDIAKTNETSKEKKPRKKKKGYSITITEPVYVPTKEEEEEIKLREKSEEMEAVDALKKMSDATAGRFYQSDTQRLKGVFNKVAGELRQQYRLGFHSKDATGDAASHDIIVKVDRPDAVVIARGKYRVKQL